MPRCGVAGDASARVAVRVARSPARGVFAARLVLGVLVPAGAPAIAPVPRPDLLAALAEGRRPRTAAKRCCGVPSAAARPAPLERWRGRRLAVPLANTWEGWMPTLRAAASRNPGVR